MAAESSAMASLNISDVEAPSTPAAAVPAVAPLATTPGGGNELFRTLFVYGPCLSEEVVTKLLGRVPRSRPAKLPGYVRCCKKGAQTEASGVCTTHRSLIANCYPAVIGTGIEGHEVEGIIYERLRPKEIRCLDYCARRARARALPLSPHFPFAWLIIIISKQPFPPPSAVLRFAQSKTRAIKRYR